MSIIEFWILLTVYPYGQLASTRQPDRYSTEAACIAEGRHRGMVRFVCEPRP